MELVDVQYLGNTPDYQVYSDQDKNLINKVNVNGVFGGVGDYIEYFIYDLNDQIIAQNYNVTSYTLDPNVLAANGTYTSLNLDPEQDVRDSGFNRGAVAIKYNFLKQVLSSGPNREFWIKEISTSRTEIKVARQDLSNNALSTAFDEFNGLLTNNNYYPDFYLNFGVDVEVIGINAVYVEEDGTGYILFKLYEPLPFDYDLKSQFWVVLKNADSAKFQVTIEAEAEVVVDQFALRGANYNVAINQKAAQTTPYYTYDSLFSTTVSSSYQQLQSLFDEKAVTINTDYSNFENFIHFSSATERVNNFAYKIGLIEQYTAGIVSQSSIPGGTSTTPIVNSSIATLQQNIDNIITKFDGYEHYLYFTSASTAWPKSTSTQPYTLYSITSSQALAWLGDADTLPTSTGLSILYSASIYDNLNSDGLRYTAPTYIREDEENEPYLVFLDMIGQHFDNIWIYYNDVTNRFSAENNPNVGISLDLVGDALKGLGIELYTNTNVSDNIYYSLLGINPDGSLLPPTGSELITNYVTSSITTLPAITIEEEVYKRLYHNLPYLLKTKGTERGVRALIACYGIPNSILSINEFGGYNMFAQGDVQGIQDNKIYTGSIQQLGSDVLSPYTTLQYYQNDFERNSYDLEVGFSPADSINADITGSLPTLSVQQLIGDPNLQYSSSYTPLEATKETYFAANYTKRYNVWDFIRIIKYYNNSLFKMIKDFVPARASLSTAIIVKSHILERNKYARHEPEMTTSSYEDTIKMVAITGSDADLIKYPTSFIGSTMTQNGLAAVNNSFSFEKYTGQFSGSIIKADVAYFPQTEQSYQPDITYTSQRALQVAPQYIRLNATYQNVTSSVKSRIYFDLDYSTNQAVPVNYNLITQSLDAGVAALTNPYAPYAELQDYNYSARRSTLPRYVGSKTSGKAYNIHSDGDSTYGNYPVINWNTLKLGLFTQLQTSSFFPGLVNASLAYLADVSGGLFELNQRNTHWTDVQNTFKAGTTLTIKQFDNKKYSKQQTSDGIKLIFNSGYSYSPLIYFTSCSGDPTISFELLTGELSGYQLTARNSISPTGNIFGASPITYPPFGLNVPSQQLPFSQGVGNLFETVTDGVDYYTPSTGTTFPKYEVQQAGTYQIQAAIPLKVSVPTTTINQGQTTQTWVLQVYRTNSNNIRDTNPLFLDRKTFTLGAVSGTVTLRVTRCYYKYNTAGVLTTGFTITLSQGLPFAIYVKQSQLASFDFIVNGNSLIQRASLNTTLIPANATTVEGTSPTSIPSNRGSYWLGTTLGVSLATTGFTPVTARSTVGATLNGVTILNGTNGSYDSDPIYFTYALF